MLNFDGLGPACRGRDKEWLIRGAAVPGAGTVLGVRARPPMICLTLS
jgi:hypothetical protein